MLSVSHVAACSKCLPQNGRATSETEKSWKEEPPSWSRLVAVLEAGLFLRSADLLARCRNFVVTVSAGDLNIAQPVHVEFGKSTKASIIMFRTL